MPQSNALDGRTYRGLLGPPTATWQVALGAAGVLAASVPAVVFSAELTSALYGDAIAPMFAVVDLPPLASVVSVLVVPLLAEQGRLNRPSSIICSSWADEGGPSTGAGSVRRTPT